MNIMINWAWCGIFSICKIGFLHVFRNKVSDSSYLSSSEVRYYLSIPEVGSQVVRLMPEL